MGLTRRQVVTVASYAAAEVETIAKNRSYSFSIKEFMAYVSSLDVDARATLHVELDQYDAPRLQRVLSRCSGSDEASQQSFEVEMDADGNWLRDGR